MTKSKLYGSLSLAALVLLSSGKKEAGEELYTEQIRSLTERVDVFGDTMKLKSIEGKMLIVNFWASYDATSRINAHSLAKLAEQYADAEFYNSKGLEVVSVSLDTYRSPLKKAISADGTENFHHICDFKGTESEMAKSFDVNRPVNLLIDANGKIVARDFKVQTLATTLEMMTCNN